MGRIANTTDVVVEHLRTLAAQIEAGEVVITDYNRHAFIEEAEPTRFRWKTYRPANEERLVIDIKRHRDAAPSMG